MRRIPRPSPSMIIALIALGIAIGGTAYATGEGNPILGGARNPGTDQSKALTKETQIISSTSGYGTRQSNKSSSGGGAVYGCRSGAGGTAASNEPCVRANNLSARARVRARHRRVRGRADRDQGLRGRRSRPTAPASRRGSTPTASTASTPIRSSPTRAPA